MSRKIAQLDWVYQTARPGAWQNGLETPLADRIKAEVRREVGRLSPEEREFVELFWFQGLSPVEIAELLGRKPYKLEALNKRILRKLKARLSRFARTEFGICGADDQVCPICTHTRRLEIDALIRAKPPQQTFRRVIAALKAEYQLAISTPQVIIGHIKYHLWEE